MVSRVHLVRVVSAAVEPPDVVIAEVGDHLACLRILAEEMLARVCAAERLARLVLAVDGFHHQLAQHALGVAGEEWIPVAAPDQLDRIPATATAHTFQSLAETGRAPGRERGC